MREKVAHLLLTQKQLNLSINSKVPLPPLRKCSTLSKSRLFSSLSLKGRRRGLKLNTSKRILLRSRRRKTKWSRRRWTDP